MKRWTTEHIHQIAREFAGTSLAASWHMFGREIRSAILDSAVMDALRMADCADSALSLTAAEIVRFRAELEQILADGVKRHARAMKVRFEVHS